MSEAIRKFLSSGLEMPATWENLDFSAYPSPFAEPLPLSSLPLYQSPWLEALDHEEQQALGRGFIKLNAEALIVLEQALLVGMRRFVLPAQASEHAVAQKLAWEEYYHTRAFRKFLMREPVLRWKEQSLFLFRNRRCRKWLAILAALEPAALCLPGAKIEAYSLTYSRFVRDSFGGWEKNIWTKIQHLHVLDEAHHVPMQFELYTRTFPRGLRAVRLALAMFAFICVLQVLLLSGNWRMVKYAMPKRPLAERIRWTFRVARWCVRDFRAYTDARLKMRDYLAKPGLPLGSLFAFMAW